MAHSPRKRTCSTASSTAITAMMLESPDYNNKILTGLHELRQSELLCDYTLAAGDCEMKVHRVVMVASSDYFRAMLTGEMRESRDNRVHLQGLTGTGLRAVIDFAYTGRLELTMSNLDEVLLAASHLQISEAIELCCQFIEKAITVENCVEMLNLTELFSLRKCRVFVTNFILEHFEKLAEAEQYNRFSIQQLSSLLEKNNLCVVSEYKLFELVLKWIDADPDARTRHTPQLMRNIRLPLLSGEELVEKVSKVPIMQQNRACNELLSTAKDYHIVVNKQPMLQSSRTRVRANKPSLVMCHAENLESYDFVSEKHAYLKDAPVPLYNPCVCVVDNFMYACGGKYDSNENNEIATARCFRYDPRFDSWFELPSMNEARKDFVLVAYRNMLMAIAGQDENSVMYSCECFHIDKNDWSSCKALPSEVYGHAGAVCGNRVYISGGQHFDGHSARVLSYSSDNDAWVNEISLLQPRSNHSMLEVADSLYVLGGNTEDSYSFPVPVTTIERFVPASGQWVQYKATLNIREAGDCVFNGKIFIVGGINGQHYYSDLIQCYNTAQDIVTVEDKFPSRIYGRACAVLTLPQYI